MMGHLKMSRAFTSFMATMAVALSYPAPAQSLANADKLPAFDVVSIRPSSEASKSGIKILPDGYESIGYPLEQTVYLAYVPAPFFKHLDEVKGFPSWATSEKYDVRAKVAPEEAEHWRSLQLNVMTSSVTLQQMLRSVLAERCNLRMHPQETLTDAYALIRRPNAPSLTESTELPSAGTIMELTDGAEAVFEKHEGERVYTFYNTPMSVLATFIGIPSKRPVEDRTGLHGRYKVVLHAIDATSPDGEATQSERPVPYDLRAIGMTVESIKVKSTVWTIDRMDRPTPN